MKRFCSGILSKNLNINAFRFGETLVLKIVGMIADYCIRDLSKIATCFHLRDRVDEALILLDEEKKKKAKEETEKKEEEDGKGT